MFRTPGTKQQSKQVKESNVNSNFIADENELAQSARELLEMDDSTGVSVGEKKSASPLISNKFSQYYSKIRNDSRMKTKNEFLYGDSESTKNLQINPLKGDAILQPRSNSDLPTEIDIKSHPVDASATAFVPNKANREKITESSAQRFLNPLYQGEPVPEQKSPNTPTSLRYLNAIGGSFRAPLMHSFSLHKSRSNIFRQSTDLKGGVNTSHDGVPTKNSSPIIHAIREMSSISGSTSDDDVIHPEYSLSKRVQPKSLFSPAVGPMQGKYEKVAKTVPSTSVKLSVHRGVEPGDLQGAVAPGSPTKSSRHSDTAAVSNVRSSGYFMKAIADAVDRDHSGRKRPPAPAAAFLFEPSEGSARSHSDDSDFFKGLSDERQPRGSDDISMASRPPVFPLMANHAGFVGLADRDRNRQGFPSIEDALRNMGIANRQEGGMDFESALLIVLMDPTHPYGQMFRPTSQVGNIYDTALRANEMELERMINELSDDHSDVIALKAATADLYKGLDMPLAAEVLLRQVIDSQRRIFGPDNSDTISSMNDLGLLMVSTQRYAEAQTMFEEVVSAVCRTQGEAHPDAAAALGNLAVALRMQRTFANAIPVHERAVLILEQATGVGRDHPDSAYQRSLMGGTYVCMGSEQKGCRLIEEALMQMQERNHLSNVHPWVLSMASLIRH